MADSTWIKKSSKKAVKNVATPAEQKVIDKWGGNSYAGALANRDASLKRREALMAKYQSPTYAAALEARNANLLRRENLMKRTGAATYEKAVAIRNSRLAAKDNPVPSNQTGFYLQPALTDFLSGSSTIGGGSASGGSGFVPSDESFAETAGTFSTNIVIIAGAVGLLFLWKYLK